MKPPEAHTAVAKAKRQGLLTAGSCELADETCYGRIEAHHEDYEQPLEVRWLCIRHHGFVHRGRRPRQSKANRLTEIVKLKLDSETLDALRRLAALGDRTVAAEMRRALREHVKAAGQEAA